MNRTVSLSRQRRAPLSEILARRRPAQARPMARLHEAFAPTRFAPTHGDERAFASTQFVERRRVPRSTGGTRPAADPGWSATFGFAATDGSAGGGWPLSPASAGGSFAAMASPGDDGPDTGPDSTIADGPGLLPGWLSRLQRLLDPLPSSALGALVMLLVCISLAMAVMSALGPLMDR